MCFILHVICRKIKKCIATKALSLFELIGYIAIKCIQDTYNIDNNIRNKSIKYAILNKSNSI